jgi:hypothetical protein
MSRPCQLSKHYVINPSNTSTFILLKDDHMFRSAKTIIIVVIIIIINITTIKKLSKYSAIILSRMISFFRSRTVHIDVIGVFLFTN